MAEDEDVEEVVFDEVVGRFETISNSSLMVNVEFLDLVEKYGEEETWVILGKLKDLLG